MGTRLNRLVDFLIIIFIFVVFIFVAQRYYFKNALWHTVIRPALTNIQKATHLHLKTQFHTITFGYEASKLSEGNTATKNATSIPVLVYHGIVDSKDNTKLSAEDTSLKLFKEQMFYLKEYGYQTITLPQFISFIDGKAKLPDKSFLLTFDDGRKDSYYNADGVLKALQFNAVIFVITSHSIGKEESGYYLNQKELVQMVDTGRWNVQSHGKDDHIAVVIDAAGHKGHFMTNRKWLSAENRSETEEEFKKRIYNDMVESKRDLEETLGTIVNTYAFPFGDYGKTFDSETVRIVRSVYPYSFIQSRSDRNIGYYRQNFQIEDDIFLIRRMKVTESLQLADLMEELTSSEEKKLPYTTSFSDAGHDWVSSSTGDEYTIAYNTLTMSTTPSKYTSSVYLDGSTLWQDYIFSADILAKSGNGYGLIARAENGKNYLMCSFQENAVKLDRHTDGVRELLVDTEIGYSFNPHTLNRVGISVKGNDVTCLVNGKVAVHTTLKDNLPDHGQIGFNILGTKTTPTAINIHKISVTKPE